MQQLLQFNVFKYVVATSQKYTKVKRKSKTTLSL